jgi:broad specificity phosphatase PhoE
MPNGADPQGGRLILARHALPEMDPDMPAVRWPLSVEGMASCVVLAQELAAYAPDRIVTSRTRKAFETGRILAENLYIPVEPVDDLEEMHRTSIGWIASSSFVEGVRRAILDRESVVFGDESLAQAISRFEKGLALAAPPGDTDTVIAVTHGTVMAAYLADRTGEDAFEVWRRLGMPAYAVLERPDMNVLTIVPAI